MKKFLFASLCLAAVLLASGCAVRTADDLPKSTRIDRDIVARASLAVNAGVPLAVPQRDATFRTRDDGTIVFYPKLPKNNVTTASNKEKNA